MLTAVSYSHHLQQQQQPAILMHAAPITRQRAAAAAYQRPRAPLNKRTQKAPAKQVTARGTNCIESAQTEPSPGLTRAQHTFRICTHMDSFLPSFLPHTPYYI